MSEIIKDFKKGDLLYIGEDGKAEWGYPEGYPYKEQSEHTITTTVTEEGLSIDRDGVVETIPGSDIDGLLVNSGYLRIADPIDQDAIKTMRINDIPVSEFWDFMMQNGLVTDDYVVYELFVCTYKDDVTDPIRRIWPTAGFYVNLNKITEVYTIEWTEKTIHTMAPESLSYATTTTPGTVKQMSYLPNATGDAPTAEDFNQLLRQLKSAGVMK